MRGTFWLALVAVAMFWVTTLGSVAEAAESACADRVITDYAAPLDKMPANRLPGGGELPFAPHGVELDWGRSVLVEGEPVAYTLSLNRPVSGNQRLQRPVGVGWSFDLQVESVDLHGRPTGIAAHRRWSIRELRRPERRFGLRAKPGLYRASITIRKISGTPLARFRQFVRILPRRQSLQIELVDAGTPTPGQAVVARIANRGTREAVLPNGPALNVEHLTVGLWTEFEVNEPPSVIFESEFLPAGRGSRCSFFMIPASSHAEAFRFSAVVQTGSGPARLITRQFFPPPS